MDAQRQHDVIVVGSGSTGGVLAAKLSEAGRSVLLLEAGPAYRAATEMPAELLAPSMMSAAVPGHPNNWGYPAELRSGVSFPYPRGKALGGSSSINGAYFIRGTEADFASWAGSGLDRWTYDDVLPYYVRAEADRDFDGPLHNQHGPIPVTREPLDRAPEFTKAFTQACLDAGFPDDPDKNVPSAGGIGPVPLNVADGRRYGSALAYIIPAMGRPNLEVVGDATVHRVVLEGTKAVGVEAMVNGELVTLRGDEIVIATGALRSPQLLMLSGIGPAAHLAEHGIAVTQDLAGVGQGLTDHPMVYAPWSLKASLSSDMTRGSMTSVLHWEHDGAQLEILPFVTRSADMLGAEDLITSPKRAVKAMRGSSIKTLTREAKMLRHPRVSIVLAEAESRGTVSLSSADPTDMPVSRWNLLSGERDRRMLREATRVTDQLWRSAPMQEIGAKIVGLDEKTLRDEAALDAWVAANIGSGHPSSTCRMGVETDPMAVVDQDLRVHGIDGLRVADTSIFPVVPSRGPNATAMMVGERLADLMTGATAEPISRRAPRASVA